MTEDVRYITSGRGLATSPSMRMDGPLIELTKGYPSQLTLVDTGNCVKQASEQLQANLTADKTGYLAYGPIEGPADFREQLAAFLSKNYGETVNSSSLFCTAGASQGLSLVTSMLSRTGADMFVEDPSYFIAVQVLRDELDMKLHSIQLDNDGMDPDELDRKATQLSKDVPFTPSAQRPFRALVYTNPVCHNPMGICYSDDRYRQLVRLARKHNLLFICDDVYNLLHFGSGLPPNRMLKFDSPSDPDYQGNVISNGSFSKYMAPGLRLGWIEAGPRIMDILYKSKQVWSGGCSNHYTSVIMTLALKEGLVQKHLDAEREVLKEKMNAMADVLDENLPKGVTFDRPRGGYFLWLRLPEGCESADVAQHCRDKYAITLLAGNLCSSTDSHRNCIRVSFSYLPVDQLRVATKKVCQAITEYMQQK